MHQYSHQLNEQFLCMETKPIIENSSTINQHLPVSKNFIDSNSMFHTLPYKTQMSHSNPTPLSSINRYLSMPSFDQFPSINHRVEEDHPLRIHVGNIPFLWTIDDLCKQFLVFGPIKDPEIVTNERGSKGFGFITFLRHADGINAIRVKNGSIADGRKITVALASSRSSTRINSSHCHCCYINNNIVN